MKTLKLRLGSAKKKWVDELPNVLWTYQTTERVGIEKTPYNLVYGSIVIMSAEIGQDSAHVVNYSSKNGALQ